MVVSLLPLTEPTSVVLELKLGRKRDVSFQIHLKRTKND